MRHEIVVEITGAHTDSLEHLNHVEAVRFLERAREAWVRAAGFQDAFTGKAGTVVVNVELNYRLECFLGEQLRIVTTPSRLGTKSYTFDHEIIKPDGSVAITGRATSVVFDLERRETVPVPTAIAARFQPDGP